MIDSHFHLFTQDSSTPEKRAERADQVRRLLDGTGVDRVCLIGERGDSVEECRANNELIAAYVDEHPDVFYGWARVNPLWGEPGVEEFRRAVEEDGLIGLKLYAQAFLDDPEVEPLAEAAVDMDVPIISHVAHRTERSDRKPKESTDEHVRALAERFPKLNLISGHIGGGGQWERRIKNIAPVENVYLDTSGSVTQSGVLEMAVDHLGADRVVFGTDTWFLSGLGKFEGSDLSPEEKATIGYNMASLIRDDVPNSLSQSEREAGKRDATDRFAGNEEPRKERIVDANAFVGHHPFRRIDATPESLVARMDRVGVDTALVSSLHSLFYRNPHAGNVELASAIEGYEDRLVPIATIDPTYPAWRTDLRTCLSELGMRGVKLLPAHHDYDVDDPAVEDLLDECGELDVPVIIAGPTEDQRGRHPRVTLRGFESGPEDKKNWSDETVEEICHVLECCSKTDVIVANIRRRDAAKIVKDVMRSTTKGPGLRNFVRDGETLFVVDDMAVFFPNQAESIVDEIGTDHLVSGARLPLRVFGAHSIADHLPVSESERNAVRSENVLSLFD